MLRTSLATVRAHAGRLAACAAAIVLAVGFVVATLTLGASTQASVRSAVAAAFVASDAVVAPADGDVARFPAAQVAARLQALPEVGAVAVDLRTEVQVRGSGTRLALAEALADPGPLRWQHLSSGRLPATAGEVAVTGRTGLAVGDVVEVLGARAERVRVVGLVDLRGDPEGGVAGRLYALPADLRAWGAASPDQLRVAAAAGTSGAALRTAVRAAAGGQDLYVVSGEQAADDAVAGYTRDAAGLRSVLLVFAAVAVLVAGLVIANTFAVVLAQRTRDLGLLRCLGATRGQVCRGVLTEATVVGAVASGLGVAGGVGLAVGVTAVVARSSSSVPLSVVAVPASAVLAGMVVGTGVTVLAALVPARAATRVAPLAALRPLDPPPVRSRGGLLRLLVGLALLVPSAPALVVLSRSGALRAAVLAGAVSFLAVLLLAQRAVPPLVALAGRVVAPLGVPARLAASNAVRQPRRTAATATALVIGVTLTTAMVVGASSTRATASGLLEAGFPTDVVVSAGSALPAGLGPRLSALDGVGPSAAVLTADVTAGGTQLQAQAVDPASARVVVRSVERQPLPVDGVAVVSEDGRQALSTTDGAVLVLAGATGSRRLRVQVAPHSHTLLLVTAADLRALDRTAAATGLWLRLDDGDQGAQGRAVDRVSDAVSAQVPGTQVAGVAAERGALDALLHVLLLVVTGLLGVAVVIALLGVGSTMALTVVERRQESGLLRALGLTRGQLSAVLVWEALLVAGVAAVLGVALGSGYGAAGTAAVLARATSHVTVDVPWLQVAGIVVVATAAGVVASLLPARRAGRTSPVAAVAG